MLFSSRLQDVQQVSGMRRCALAEWEKLVVYDETDTISTWRSVHGRQKALIPGTVVPNPQKVLLEITSATTFIDRLKRVIVMCSSAEAALIHSCIPENQILFSEMDNAHRTCNDLRTVDLVWRTLGHTPAKKRHQECRHGGSAWQRRLDGHPQLLELTQQTQQDGSH